MSSAAAVTLVVGLLSVWFNDPTQLATAFGLMSAGLAFALQQAITSIAGHFVILRGSTFTVSDRTSMASEAKRNLKKRFGVEPLDLEPRVFFRITDNWLELTIRFVVHTHGSRNVKDAMSRAIVEAVDSAGIGIASATHDIVGFPALDVRAVPGAAPAPA